MPQRAPVGWVALAALCAIGLKLALAVNSTGTADTLYFYGATSVAGTPYSNGVRLLMVPGQFPFDEPALALHLIRFADWLSGIAHQQLWFTWRALSALADTATLFLLWSLGLSLPVLLIAALSPLAMLLSGFHGHSDAFVILLVTAAVWLEQRYPGKSLPAGVALGLAGCTQLWPLLLLPCLSGPILPAIGGAVVAWLIASLPLLVSDFGSYLKAISTLDAEINPWALGHLLSPKLVPVAGVAVLALGWWLRTRRPQQPVATRFALSALLMLALTPIAGIHHLAALQLLAFGGWELLAFVTLPAAAFLVNCYNTWTPNQPFPWQTALSIQQPWQGITVLYEAVAWLAVVAAAWAMWQRTHIERPAAATIREAKRTAEHPAPQSKPVRTKHRR